MRKIIYMLAVFFSASATLSSCLESNSSDVTLYDDMAITGFTLGTLNRYTHATSSSTGNDTLIKTTVTGSLYSMCIDHVGRRIFNQQALPAGTDLKHVTCTLTTRNNGVVYVKSLTSDTLVYHSYADSIDFTSDRIFRVFATDGSGSRDYTVSLTVDDQTGTTFTWTLAGTTADTTNLAARQLVAEGDTVTVKDREAEPDWQNEEKDDDYSLTPKAGTTVMLSWPYAPAPNTTYTLAIGAPQQDNEGYMRLWRKISTANGNAQWVFMPWDEANDYKLPLQQWYTLAYYDESILALGSNLVMLQSRDQGITWKTNTTYALPAALTGTQVLMTADEDGQCLWLVTNSGEVWRGQKK